MAELAQAPCSWLYRLYGVLTRKLATPEGRKELMVSSANEELEEGLGG